MKKRAFYCFGLLLLAGLLFSPYLMAKEGGKGKMHHGGGMHETGMHGPSLIQKNFCAYMKKEFQAFMQESETVRKDLAVAVVELRTLLSQDAPSHDQVRQYFKQVRSQRAKLREMAEARGLPHHALKKALGPLAKCMGCGHMMGKGKMMGGKSPMMSKGKHGSHGEGSNGDH